VLRSDNNRGPAATILRQLAGGKGLIARDRPLPPVLAVD
jgi:hypothetical protein